MTQPIWINAMQVLAIASSVYGIFKLKGASARRREFSSTAHGVFRLQNIDAADPRMSFKGSTAKIMHEELTGYDSGNFSLTLYAKNDAGEYFMFKFNMASQIIKHVPANIAKAVLKHRYIAPLTVEAQHL